MKKSNIKMEDVRTLLGSVNNFFMLQKFEGDDKYIADRLRDACFEAYGFLSNELGLEVEVEEEDGTE